MSGGYLLLWYNMWGKAEKIKCWTLYQRVKGTHAWMLAPPYVLPATDFACSVLVPFDPDAKSMEDCERSQFFHGPLAPLLDDDLGTERRILPLDREDDEPLPASSETGYDWYFYGP